MIKIIFNEEDISALRYWRFQHPDPRVQVRMEALLAQSRRGQCRDPAAVWDVQSKFPSPSQGIHGGRDHTAEAHRSLSSAQ